MDIDFLRAARESRERQQQLTREEQKRYQQEKGLGCFFYPVLFVSATAWLINFLLGSPYEKIRDYLSGKSCVLSIECTSEQIPAVQFSLKTALEMPYAEFRYLEGHIPGPFLCGSCEALEWFASGLRKANVPCSVRRVYPDKVPSLELFHYPIAHELSIAEAFADSRERNNSVVPPISLPIGWREGD